MRSAFCLAVALCWRASSAFTPCLLPRPPLARTSFFLQSTTKKAHPYWSSKRVAALATRATVEEDQQEVEEGVSVPTVVVSEKPKRTRTRKAATAPAVSTPPPPVVRYESHAAFVQGLESLTGDPLEPDNGRIVVYRGNPKAKLMVIGEAPGETEDQMGLPFVGRSGQLLDKILESVDFNVQTDVYVSNVVRRRPPNNRGPTVAEVEYYKPYLLEEIRLVDPYIIILTGSYSMRAILDEKQGITKVRGKWYHKVIGEEGGIDGKGTRDCMTIFHPSYLLRNPSRVLGGPKSLTWQDVKEVRRRLDEIMHGGGSGSPLSN